MSTKTVYVNMNVDKFLSSGSFAQVLDWAKEAAATAVRESEMGIDLDMSEVGESRRKMLRMEIAKLGYLMRAIGINRYELIRQKTKMWVA
ncbi:MAG: hypothetical protein KF824_01955 [Fimbriimonadaceae bacterium]|nr:MAG: hypothetical protein KF824_01955 [Fimbriimonadaceae bacterium]